MGKRIENNLLHTIVDMQKKEIERLEGEIAKARHNVYVNTKGDTNWATAPAETLKNLLDQHYAGQLNIYDYFGIGDEREVSLGGEINQNIQLVLTDKEFYELTDQPGKCAFTVDQKNLLKDIALPMNKNGSNDGGWQQSDMRGYLNNIYREAFPENIKSLFKKFYVKDADTMDYFILRSEMEIFGEHIYSDEDEPGRQIEYYKIRRNRMKCIGNDFGSAYGWWERSPFYGNSGYFCSVNGNGSANAANASGTYLIAPAGCI